MPTRTDIAIDADHHTRFGEPDQVKRECHSPCVDGRRVGEQKTNIWGRLDAAACQPLEAGDVTIGDVESQR